MTCVVFTRYYITYITWLYHMTWLSSTFTPTSNSDSSINHLNIYLIFCNHARLHVEHDWLWLLCLPLPYGSPSCSCHRFQLQLYVVSAASVHHCRQHFAIHFMYIEALVPYKIDRVLILDCQARHSTTRAKKHQRRHILIMGIAISKISYDSYGPWSNPAVTDRYRSASAAVILSAYKIRPIWLRQ